MTNTKKFLIQAQELVLFKMIFTFYLYNFKEVFQKYCWDIDDVSQIQIAPFHVLAHSKEAFFQKPHTLHMEMNGEFAGISKFFVETEYKIITDEASEAEVIQWWESLTSEGHEGIVIKPFKFTSKNKGKLLQPAIKVRVRIYLNIIEDVQKVRQK
ncbi:hypothetical protein ACOI1C_16255 [Bacillus sp. DJP31]|uniref:hypothetical protein n=1 Tax=Bacillus sp. DJP31 TaxID=3409789 RepID=UPI003BB4BF1A